MSDQLCNQMDVAALDRLEALLDRATPLPWVKANLANITTRVDENAGWYLDGNVEKRPLGVSYLRYGPFDTALCTEAVNALPALIALARRAADLARAA